MKITRAADQIIGLTARTFIAIGAPAVLWKTVYRLSGYKHDCCKIIEDGGEDGVCPNFGREASALDGVIPVPCD